MRELGLAQPNAAIGEREGESCSFLRTSLGSHRQGNVASLGEFHGVVGEIFQRCSQPHLIARHLCGQLTRNDDFGGEAFGFRPRPQSAADCFGQTAGGERLMLQRQARRIRLGGIDDERCHRGEVLGAAFHRIGPLPFSLADIGAG